MNQLAHPHADDTHIMQRLQDAQHENGGFIPRGALRGLADELQVPLYHLYGIVTFFPHFRLERPPTHEVLVCTDLSCRLQDGDVVLRRCQEIASRRSPREITVAPTSCLGRCDRAPALTVNDRAFHGLDDRATAALYDALEGGRPLPPASVSPKLDTLRLDPYADGRPRWEALRKVLDPVAPVDVLATLQQADLRGLGGAGFRAFIKWQTVRQAAATPKYVICNADESEPGTIKDRVILATAPHLLVEGMTIAGVVTGARHGIVYIRHEYGPEREALDVAIREARAAGVLGPRVLGSPSHAFDIEIFVSPGGYICGEETALMEAIEGRRAQPRLKSPEPPAKKGLWQKPTVINNVETFTHVPAIVVRGADWYRAQGTAPGAVGLKMIGISGHVARPGVYEIPMGLSLRQIVDQYAGGMRDGRALKAFITSGASSGVLPASAADVPLEWEALKAHGSMVGSSAIIVLAEGTCMVDVALNLARFFARESCGKCWPCRVGSEKVADMLERTATGKAPADVFAPLKDLALTLDLTSICALGQSVPKPITSVMHWFEDEVTAHLQGRCPEKVCRTK
jgi:NADH:ubiquinone oxidoreductase subunit F (NADH-binding)/NADH:ubiquinone oxidoreductase subunit E